MFLITYCFSGSLFFSFGVGTYGEWLRNTANSRLIAAHQTNCRVTIQQHHAYFILKYKRTLCSPCLYMDWLPSHNFTHVILLNNLLNAGHAVVFAPLCKLNMLEEKAEYTLQRKWMHLVARCSQSPYLEFQPTQCITLGMLISLTEHKNSHP